MKTAEEQLAELHAAAAKWNPKAPSPELVAALRARAKDRNPVEALANLQKALQPVALSAQRIAEIGDAWEAWDLEREPHAKALLQMRLAEHVAGLLEHGDALATALEWFADEGHYEGTYRRGAGFAGAVGLTRARAALLGLDPDDPNAVAEAWKAATTS